MPPIRFPDLKYASPEGLIGIGGTLSPENLLTAYSQGIFPWPTPDYPITWFTPPERAILEWDRLHISKSLARAERNSGFQFTRDQAFRNVIEACSEIPRPHQEGTWITPEMIDAYCELHRLGHAHSVEVWKDQKLVGGIYGVDAGGAFAGESMFHRAPNASKLSILYLLRYLHTRGLNWIDIQVLTPHLEVMGARLISRSEFLSKLRQTQNLQLQLF